MNIPSQLRSVSFAILFFISIISIHNVYAQETPDDTDEISTEEQADVTFCDESYADRLSIAFSETQDTAHIGDTVTTGGTLINKNPYPIVNATIHAKVLKVIDGTDEVPVPQYALVDTQVVEKRVSLNTDGTHAFTHTWVVPTLPTGTYRITFFVTTEDGQDISGILSSHYLGTGYVDVNLPDGTGADLAPTPGTYAPATDDYAVRFPSVSRYPLTEGEENAVFTCAYLMGTSTSPYTISLTLRDTEGNTVYTTQYDERATDETVVPIIGRFIPKDTHTSFTLALTVTRDGKTVEEVTMPYACEALGTCAEESPEVAPQQQPESATPTLTDTLQIVFLTVAILAILAIIVLVLKRRPPLNVPTLILFALCMVTSLAYYTVTHTEYTNAALATKYTPSTYTPYGVVYGTCPSTNYYQTYTEWCSFDGYQYYCPSLGYFFTLPASCTTSWGEYGPVYECPVTTTQPNGIVTNLGVHNRCVLTGVSGDYENIRACFLTGTPGGNWQVRATDEGGKLPFYCHTLCSDINAGGQPYGYGATCKVGATYGVINSSNLCCTGTYYDAGCPYYAVSTNMSCSAPNVPQVSNFTGTGASQSGTTLTNVPVGTAITLSWSVADVTQCIASGAPGWTGEVSMTGGSQNVTFSDDATYTLTCYGYTGTPIVKTVTISRARSNLVSSGFTVASGPYYVGTAMQMSAHVMNAGSASTVESFYDSFTYRYGTTGAWNSFAGNTIGHAPLGAGGTSPTLDSANTLVPAEARNDLYIQHCVDSTNVINEGVNETPNCVVNGPYTILESLKPNLVSENLTISVSPYYVGNSITMNAFVRNTGAVSTASSFYDNYSYQWNSTSGAWTEISPNTNRGVLTPGVSAGPDLGQFTPNQAGTLYIQHCVDSTNVINEGVNETPNCTISAGLSVLNIPTGNLAVSTTTINGGDTVNIIWNTTAMPPIVCTVSGGMDSWNGPSGNVTSRQLYTDTVYTLSCGGFPLQSVTVDVNTEPELSVEPRVAAYGQTVTLTWNTHNGNESSCTLSNVPGRPNLIQTTEGDPNIGSVTVPVHAKMKYTLTCPPPGGSNSVTVEIVPRTYEM